MCFFNMLFKSKSLFIQLLANSTYNSELLSNPELYDEGAILIVGNHFHGCILEGPSIVFNSSIIHPHNIFFGPCPLSSDNCKYRHKSYSSLSLAPIHHFFFVPKGNVREDIKSARSYDYCMTEPCMRHGRCISTQISYSCLCSARYSGKNCEIDLGNPCARNPPVCKNDGSCTEDSVGNYTCACKPGFTGLYYNLELRKKRTQLMYYTFNWIVNSVMQDY